MWGACVQDTSLLGTEETQILRTQARRQPMIPIGRPPERLHWSVHTSTIHCFCFIFGH